MENFLVYTAVSQPLLAAPFDFSPKICDIPAGFLVEVPMDYLGLGFVEVVYTTNSSLLKGWVKAKWLERFTLLSPNVLKIKNGTPSLNDLNQYLYYKGNVQHNLCGPLSVLYAIGAREVDVEQEFEKWNVKAPAFWRRLFPAGRSTTTGVQDLHDLCDMYDREEAYKATASKTLANVLYDKDLRRALLTPGAAVSILSKWRVIIGCSIETQFGRLRPSGVRHWVVLERIMREGRGGFVEIYNPASNAMELYDWDCFRDSVKIPIGILVER